MQVWATYGVYVDDDSWLHFRNCDLFSYLVGALPDVSGELLPVLYEHLRVAGRWWVLLMFLWDEEGHGELRLAGWALSRDHTAGHRGCHLHLHL